jgi:hypothetical protein
MKAGVELISEKHCTVSQCIDYWADKPEPDECSKRLVLRVELDLTSDATVDETHTKLLEGRALFRTVRLTLEACQDADSPLESVTYDRIWLIFLRPGDSEISRSQER